MDPQEIKEIIKRELPAVLREDPEMREFVIRLSEGRFADKKETESRFDRLLEELRLDREEQSKRWAEQDKRWEDQDKKWEENQKVLHEILDRLKAHDRRFDSTIGALGARWSLHAEEAFRSALRGILEEHFNVQVVNVVEFDRQGEVFGRPDQIELDIIIKDGLLVICEIKSSVSKADVHIFEKKVRFYERLQGKKATQVLIISPMVDQKTKVLAESLGIKVYSYPERIDPEVFE